MLQDKRADEIERALHGLLAPVKDGGQPNLSRLRLALRDIDALKLTVKMNGYALARKLAEDLPPLVADRPQLFNLASKPSTQQDLESPWARHWLAQLKLPLVFHRKLWELAYVLQVLWQTGNLQKGRRGLGFGCGQEPLPSLFAAMGVDVLVTDLAPSEQEHAGWTGTDQHTYSRDAVYNPDLVDREAFDKHVSLRYLDMRRIPDDLRSHDFCWSICALEHLGSIRAGMDFVLNSLRTLRRGGVAVHTTEYNFLSDDQTVDNWPTVLFLRRHFEELEAEARSRGHIVAPLDFDVGASPLDLFIDVPPYQQDWHPEQSRAWPVPAHLKLAIDGFAATCFGIAIIKGDWD